MDRLPPEAKRLLQVAAVICMDVSFPLLQALAEQPEVHLQQSLAHLRAADFLYETHLFPEPEYTFKHALTHEVAYHSLLLEQRRVLHARIVEALEALTPELAATHVDCLAHHALWGEVWGKPEDGDTRAVTYCQQAGIKAWDRAAFREAVAAFEQALQALAHLVLAIELRDALGNVLPTLGAYGRCLALLGEAEALAEALGMRPLVAHCHLGLGRLYAQTGLAEQARTALTIAIDLYRAMDMTFWLPQAEAALAQVEGQ
jgi:predicted ATPase